MTLLTRYWFTFQPVTLIRNVGVTAYTIEDALNLIEQEKVFYDDPIPKVVDVIEKIDVSTLDEGKILPNIGPTNSRGVWYPNLISR